MNMRYQAYLLPLVFIILAGSFLSAQNSLSGTVTDAQGMPLIGANLFFPDLKTGTITDENGHYEMKQLPAKKMLVQVSYVGYNTLLRPVEVQGNVTADFVLEEGHIESKEVVVTGLSMAQEKRRNTVSIDVLKKDFLLRSTGTNLVDNLTKVAGISAVTTGPGISKPIIRGLGYNRVLVVQDGIRQEGQQWGDEHGLEIDGYAVDRVEVFRGPATLMYGSDGLGGVINLESPHPAPEGTVKGSLQTAYHTNNQQKEVSGFVTTTVKGWNGYLIGSYRDAGDYQNAYDGKVFNTGFEEKNGSGMFGTNRKWGYSQLRFSTFNQRLGLAEGERDENGHFLTAEAPFQKISHQKVGWNNALIFNKSSLKTVIGFQKNLRREFTAPDELGLFFDMGTFTYDLKYYVFEKKNWEYTFGFSGMVQDSKNKGTEVLVPAYSLRDEGGFAYLRRILGKMEWSAGIRYDQRHFQVKELAENGETRFPALSRNFGQVSGSVGMSWFPTDQLVLKLNLARGFRSPNIAELSSNGVHEGTFRYELGNAGLDAETNLELDGGLELDLKHVTLSLSPFFNRINHYIFIEKIGAADGTDSLTIVDGTAFPTFQYTQHNPQLYGGEFSLDFHPHPYDWLHVKNTFSMVLAEQLNSPNKYVPFIPPFKYQLELRTDIPTEWTYFRALSIGTAFDYFFKQDRILSANDFETPTPAYGLWDANIGVDWTNKAGKTRATVLFAATNILDKTYQDHLNRLKYAPLNPATGRQGIFNMGRNFTLKLEVPLEGQISKKL